jgi:tripartite-type tricarboxylate transporter receptor subunit TctC
MRLTAAAACALIVAPAYAQQGKDFYKGKTVTYIVATAAGGGYDFYGRLVAGAMEKNLPGSTFIVRNMPGAGHLIGANFVANSKPDGLTLGTFNTGLIYNQLINLKGVRFDLAAMSWVGKAASDPRVLIVSAQSPIKNFEDLRKAGHEVRFAVAGIGSAAYVEQVMLKNALNLPMKIITGYNGNADQLAMRRGEIEGGLGSLSSWTDFVKNGYGRFLAQIGGSEKAAPQLMSLVKDAKARELIALIQSQGDLSRFTVGPAGIPGDRLEALRTAYRGAMADKDVQDKAAKSGRPLDPLIGDDVTRSIREALKQSPETIALLKEAMDAGKNVKIPEFKGTIAGLADRNKLVTMKLADGKEFKTEISGSRTAIKIAGKDAKREALATGMSCTITAERSGGEAKLIDCK